MFLVPCRVQFSFVYFLIGPPPFSHPIKIMNKILQIFAALVFIIIAWEHTARLYETEIKPSVSLTFIARHLKTGWEKFGRFCARISSFFIHLKFEELWHTFVDLMTPIVDIILSPFWWIIGYFRVVAEYKWPLLVFGGSATLVGTLLWLVDRYWPGKVGSVFGKIIWFTGFAVDPATHERSE